MTKITILITILVLLIPISQLANSEQITNTKHERTKMEILKCESNFRHDVWGDNGRAYGIAQFHKPTFEWLKGLANMRCLEWKSEKDQIKLLDWALRNGYGKLWSCFQENEYTNVMENDI